MEEPKKPHITARKESSPQVEELEDRIAELVAEAIYNVMLKRAQSASQNKAKIDKNI